MDKKEEKLQIDDFIEKIREVIKTDKEAIHIFNAEEVKTLKTVIQFVTFLRNLGTAGNIMLKILVWGTAMITSIAVYHGYFKVG